jgi:alkyl hydroperoxide reductase subunit AhpC
MAGDGYGDKMLTIGDMAPTVEISHFLKGDPVEEFETGNVYVLEFWATWCVPCKVSIPHISELQQQFEDYNVTIIGVSDEKLQTVVKFLSKADSETVLWTDKIQYTLATDPDKTTYKAYMTPAAQQAIPTAFVIGKDSRIEWIGSTMELDEVLGKVVRDEWDRDAFKVEYEQKVAPVRKSMKMRTRMDAAVERSDWDAAIGVAKAITEERAEYTGIEVRLFRQMVRKDPARAYGYGRKLIEQNWDSSKMLNGLAWITVDDKDVKSRDLKFAMKAAKRACEVTDYEDAAVLDTLARVYYEKGDFQQAIKWQRDAVKQAGGPMADQLREVLISYEKEAAGRI